MNVKQEIEKMRQRIDDAKNSLDLAVNSYELICNSLFGTEDNIEEDEIDDEIDSIENVDDFNVMHNVEQKLPRGAAVILNNLGKRPLEVQEICDQLKYSKRTVEVYLSKLKTSGLAVFDGKGWKKAA